MEVTLAHYYTELDPNTLHSLFSLLLLFIPSLLFPSFPASWPCVPTSFTAYIRRQHRNAPFLFPRIKSFVVPVPLRGTCSYFLFLSNLLCPSLSHQKSHLWLYFSFPVWYRQTIPSFRSWNILWYDQVLGVFQVFLLPTSVGFLKHQSPDP